MPCLLPFSLPPQGRAAAGAVRGEGLVPRVAAEGGRRQRRAALRVGGCILCSALFAAKSSRRLPLISGCLCMVAGALTCDPCSSHPSWQLVPAREARCVRVRARPGIPAREGVREERPACRGLPSYSGFTCEEAECLDCHLPQ